MSGGELGWWVAAEWLCLLAFIVGMPVGSMLAAVFVDWATPPVDWVARFDTPREEYGG